MRTGERQSVQQVTERTEEGLRSGPTNYAGMPVKPWMRRTLRIAGLYNLAFGLFVVLAPAAVLGLIGLETASIPPMGIVFWQCIGMIVGVYGIGYLIAAGDPVRHWPIVLVGLLGKVLGPIGFVDAALIRGVVDPAFGWVILFNDLIWWVPFGLILAAAYKVTESRRRAGLLSFRDDGADVAEPMRRADADGYDLVRLSEMQPLLIVFLRHFGCTFCRETLQDLAEQHASVDAAELRVVLVHMVEHDVAQKRFAEYGLHDAISVSDPLRRMYRVFGLESGGVRQLLGARVWLRGVLAGLFGGHGVGRLAGDGLQMPGAFVVRNGCIVAGFRHADAADRPDYAQIAAACGDGRCAVGG